MSFKTLQKGQREERERERKHHSGVIGASRHAEHNKQSRQMGLWQTLGTGTERGRACRCLRWTGALVSYSFNGVIYLFQSLLQTHTQKEGRRGEIKKRSGHWSPHHNQWEVLKSAAISHQMEVNSNIQRYWLKKAPLCVSYMMQTKLQFQDAAQFHILERNCMQFVTSS